MRRKRENQRPLSGLWPDHRLARELRAVSKILDDNPSILDLVLHDLGDTDSSGQAGLGKSRERESGSNGGIRTGQTKVVVVCREACILQEPSATGLYWGR